MRYLYNGKFYFFIIMILVLNVFLAACKNNKNESYEFLEKQVNYDDYLFVSGIDSKGHIVTADANSFIIFDESLNVLKDIPHNFTEPFNCYANGDFLYVSTISQSIIYRYSLKDDKLNLLDEINLGFTNASVIKMREYSKGLCSLVFFKDSEDLSMYNYDFKLKNIAKLDITGVDWYDSISDNELLISSDANNKITFYTYSFENEAIGDSYYFNDYIQDFTCFGDKNILKINGSNQLLSTDLKDGTKKIIYQGAENAVLSSFIYKNGDHFYFCDTANHLLIKLPVEGVYQSSYTPSEKEYSKDTSSSNEAIEDFPDIPGQHSINQMAIDEELDKITPISEDEFELIILTDNDTMRNESADAIYKHKFPNAKITYKIIQSSGLEKEGGNPYESEYDRQLKLKLLANESDFDLFYIKSPETLTQVVHSGGYLDLSGPKIQNCMDQMFNGVVDSCTYNDTVFGLPVSTSFYAMQLNNDLVKDFKLDYPFKKVPLKYNELLAFAQKYCKDYNNDGTIDVFLTSAQEYTLENGSQITSNNLLLNRRYDTSYINFLRNDGVYNSVILKKIDEINNQLEPYCLNTSNATGNNYLFMGLEGVYPVNPIDDSPATYFPIFEDKEVYQATYHYLCGNKFSDKKEYVIEYLNCIGDVLNISSRNLIYKNPSVYEKYLKNIKIDPEQFAFYQRIVDHSIPSAILSWESLNELTDVMNKELKLYYDGQITSDVLYDRYNQKLELILEE